MIERREYRFVLVVGIVALAVTSIPYVLGAVLATETRVFGGFVYALEDCYSYLAKMRLGAEGRWLFRIAYTAESSPGTLYFPFHLLLGKIAAFLPGDDLTTRMIWVYHGARLVFGMGLLLSVYRFIAAFTEQMLVRRLAWLIATFGSGLGWLLVALGQPGWLGSMPLDFILPEGFTFLILYAFPHIALARTLLLWGILFLLRSWGVLPEEELERHHPAGKMARMPPRWRRSASLLREWEGLKWGAAAGLAWLLMGLVVPFYVAIAWAVMGAGWVALALRERKIPRRAGMLAGVAGLVSSPIVLYSMWVFTSDPVYEVWGAQNLILSPHPFHYLAAYGILLLLALVALRGAWRDRRPLWFAVVWVGIVPLLVYLPFNLQRRLVEGVQVPLSMLAALGLVKFVQRWRADRAFRPKLMIVFTLIVLSLTNLMLVAGNSLVLRDRPSPIYREVFELVALDWLGERVGFDDVVLTAYETGNYLPARAKARVFLGHGPETLRVNEKQALTARFFDARTDDDWRRDLLAAYGIDYVFWGPAERQLGHFDPHSAPYLRSVYEANGYAVFDVGEVEP